MLGLWKIGLVRALHLSPLKFSCPVNSDSRTSLVGTTFKAWFWRFFLCEAQPDTSWHVSLCVLLVSISTELACMLYCYTANKRLNSVDLVLVSGEMSSYEESESKFWRKAKENPFVPVGEYILWQGQIKYVLTTQKFTFWVYWMSFQRIWGICCCLIFVLMTFAFCRDGWICCHCWLQADENEKSWRYKNVGAPDSHACSCPRLCGGSNDCWWVIFQFLLPNCNQFFIFDLWFEPEIIIL